MAWKSKRWRIQKFSNYVRTLPIIILIPVNISRWPLPNQLLISPINNPKLLIFEISEKLRTETERSVINYLAGAKSSVVSPVSLPSQLFQIADLAVEMVIFMFLSVWQWFFSFFPFLHVYDIWKYNGAISVFYSDFFF